MPNYLSPLQRFIKFVISVKNYVETGFIDVIQTAACNADTYRPGTLNFNTSLSAKLAAQATPMQGKVVIDNDTLTLTEYPFSGETITTGSQSKSIGCSAFVDEITVGTPCDTTYTGGGFCDLGLRDKKLTVQQVSSASYTGKLKLFIQAMFGSTRGDYIRFTNDTLKIANGTDNEYLLQHTGIDSSWLLTFPDFQYAICSISGSNLVITPLQLTADAAAFAAILESHARKSEWAFATRIETYILAYARPDLANQVSIVITGPTVSGQPLSHGWHANWSGTQVDIVTFYADVPNSQYLANQYKLTITIGAAPGYTTSAVMTQSVTDEPFYCFTGSGFNLFHYDDSVQDMMPVPKAPGTMPTFNFNAPIYCFRKLDITTGDCELHTVFIEKNLSAGSSYYDPGPSRVTAAESYIYHEEFSPSPGNPIGEMAVNVVGPQGFSMTHTNESKLNHIREEFVFIQEDPWVYNLGSDGGVFDNNATWIAGLGYSLWSSSGGALYYINGSGDWAVLGQKPARFQIHYESHDLYLKHARYFVESPKGECDGIIVGQFIDEAGDGNFYNLRVEGRHWWRAGLFQTTHLGGPPGSLISEFTGDLHVRGWFQYPLGKYTLDQAFTTVDAPGYPVSVPAEDNYSTEIMQSIGTDIAESVFTSTGLGAEQEYFAATEVSPGVGAPDVARSSLQSGSKVSHLLYSTNTGWLHDASVGWC